MENMVFLIDLPKVKDQTNCLTLFGQELCYFLKACGLDESLISSLSKYDFSETDRYRFVHTMCVPSSLYLFGFPLTNEAVVASRTSAKNGSEQVKLLPLV
jgi:hypothetical protein